MSLLFYHIYDLRRFRRFISLSVAKTIAAALVSSRFDYCNSVLYNTANKDIAKLQRVHFILGRVVTLSHFSRSVSLLKSLHWLPVHYRIIFKICTTAYQALSSTQQISKFDANSSKKFQTATFNQYSSTPLYIPWVKTKAGT